jgi:hypothetical protein
MVRVDNKNALPAKGSLYVEFTFNVIEKKGNFKSQGQSRFYNNVRENKNKMLNDAIYNGVKKVFPSGTVTSYNIIIIYYNYTYYIDKYQIVEKNNKYYERFRDKEKKRTRYYVINDKNVIAPDTKFGGIYK